MSVDETIRVGCGADEAVRLAAEQVVAVLENTGPTPCVALAGGRTPAKLYSALTEQAWRERVHWSSVRWFWGDERAVPPDHPDSNYRMACETLLRPLGVPAEHVHRMPADADDLPAAARRYEQVIRECVSAGADGIPIFDLVLLGLGADGHTASLFPFSSALAERERLVVAHEVPSLRVWRMTLTIPLIRAARRIVFLVTGADKAEAVSHVLSPQADPQLLPAAAFCESAGPTVWVLDSQAARLVQPGSGG